MGFLNGLTKAINDATDSITSVAKDTANSISDTSTNAVSSMGGLYDDTLNNVDQNLREMLHGVDLTSTIEVLEIFQKESGQNISPLIDFVKDLNDYVADTNNVDLQSFLLLVYDHLELVLSIAEAVEGVLPQPASSAITIVIKILNFLIVARPVVKNILGNDGNQSKSVIVVGHNGKEFKISTTGDGRLCNARGIIIDNHNTSAATLEKIIDGFKNQYNAVYKVAADGVLRFSNYC